MRGVQAGRQTGRQVREIVRRRENAPTSLVVEDWQLRRAEPMPRRPRSAVAKERVGACIEPRRHVGNARGGCSASGPPGMNECTCVLWCWLPCVTLCASSPNHPSDVHNPFEQSTKAALHHTATAMGPSCCFKSTVWKDNPTAPERGGRRGSCSTVTRPWRLMKHSIKDPCPTSRNCHHHHHHIQPAKGSPTQLPVTFTAFHLYTLNVAATLQPTAHLHPCHCPKYTLAYTPVTARIAAFLLR